MRSALLLVGYLAVLPFISATPGPISPRGDNPGPMIVPRVSLDNNDVYTYQGCRAYPSLIIPSPALTGAITVKICLTACNSANHRWGGVRYQQCFCGDADHGAPISNGPCMELTCAGDDQEYCGSNAALVIYEKQ